MAVITGKTGADAIFKAIKRICIVLSHFSSKLSAVVDQAVVDGAITSAQATVAKQLITLATDFCIVYELLADYSGFTE